MRQIDNHGGSTFASVVDLYVNKRGGALGYRGDSGIFYWRWPRGKAFTPFTWNQVRKVERVRSPFELEDGAMFHLEGRSEFCFWASGETDVEAILNLAEESGAEVGRRARTVIGS